MISYICNQERFCKNKDCGMMCSHTSDLTYAKNWDSEPTQKDLNRFFVRYGHHSTSDPDYFEKETRNLQPL